MAGDETVVLASLEYANSLTYQGFKAFKHDREEWLGTLRNSAGYYERILSGELDDHDRAYIEDALKTTNNEIDNTVELLSRLEYNPKLDQ